MKRFSYFIRVGSLMTVVKELSKCGVQIRRSTGDQKGARIVQPI
jgi:hypothetical protein